MAPQHGIGRHVSQPGTHGRHGQRAAGGNVLRRAGGHQRISAALDGPAAVVAVGGLQA